MHADASTIAAKLQAWRELGLDACHPLRFAYLEALAARLPRLQGAARELLEQRLTGLLEEYAREGEGRPDDGSTSARARETAQGRGALGRLLDDIASARTREPGALAGTAAEAEPAPEPAPVTAIAPTGEMPLLQEVREIWDGVRTASQLRQSLVPAQEDAGPLNSSVLVHRALTLMQATSPEYLQHFVAYAEALSWMEQLQQVRLPPAPATGAAPKKPAKPRVRRAAKPKPLAPDAPSDTAASEPGSSEPAAEG